MLIVDEAVYALQEMQPGLEKVYFTLQEELLKPQAQAVFKPGERIDDLVREPVLADAKQQIAEVLLTAVRPKPPARWNVDPVAQRRHQLEEKIAQIGMALQNYASSNKPFLVENKKTNSWEFKPGLLDEAIKQIGLGQDALTDPLGNKLTLETVARLEKNFTPDNLARSITQQRLQQLQWTLINYANSRQREWLRDGKWNFPTTALADAARQQRLDSSWLVDAWGTPIKLAKLDKKRDNPSGQTQFDFHELVSAGPDRKFGTKDDVRMTDPNGWQFAQLWWAPDDMRLGQVQQGQFWGWGRLGKNANMFMFRMQGGRPRGGFSRALGGAPMPGAAPMAGLGGGGGVPRPEAAKMDLKLAEKPDTGGGGGPAAPTRLREYFPETLLWQPALLTDDHGFAKMPLTFADSITTWRLTASASSRGGLLGGVTTPLRVFQDFFVDLDLPLALTQNDEVAFPVAVYNYLKQPQTVRLDLQPEPWFELVDGLGLSRALDLKPNEVTSVKFRLRAKKIGHFPLTVQAQGSKMSDAIKRSIDVVPDGQKVEQVVTDQLKGTVTQSILIPDNAIPDASKLFVKVYPGVMSQVLEGAEGLLRLPGG